MALRRRSTDQSQSPLGMIGELERLFRRAKALLLILPVLLFSGWGLGKVTSQGIALPPEVDFRIAETTHTPSPVLESLSRYIGELRTQGLQTENDVNFYRQHVVPVEESLRKWGVDRDLAREVAWPLVENVFRHELDPATVVAIVLIESRGKPDATSFVGARGLMQIMPLHQGEWQGCGEDMYDIENNLCYGTSIYAWLLRRFRNDERRALLAYNGCVRGTNTPNCHTYPDKVARIRAGIQGEWDRRAPDTVEPYRLGSAAAP